MEHTMKTMLTMIASLLLASGCATVDLNGGSDHGFSQTGTPDILQQMADSSQGG
jgi:uncharacterized protein YceK